MLFWSSDLGDFVCLSPTEILFSCHLWKYFSKIPLAFDFLQWKSK